jgi:hypothetical protein
MESVLAAVPVLLLIAAVAVLMSLPAYSAESAGTSGADFLELGIGSRPLSMGEAFTAEINDIAAIYYNPAGLATLKFPLLSIQHQELIVDSRLENISIAWPMYGGVLGVSNTIFWVPSFEKVDINGAAAGEVSFYNGAFTAAYAYDFEYIYAGASVKYIYQRIDNLFVNSAAVDIGLLRGFYLYSPFDSPAKNFHLGLSFLNLGTGAMDDPLPRMMRFGFSYKLTKWFGINTDLTENFIHLSDMYDFTHGFNESFRVNTGVEFSYLDLLYLRGGYRFNDAGGYTLGLGFNYVTGRVAFIVDTSYVDSGVFGPTYSFNVTFKLISEVITVERLSAGDNYYKEGIKFFIADDLENALASFEKCREYNPYHKNIDKKISDIKEILELRERSRQLDDKLKKK